VRRTRPLGRCTLSFPPSLAVRRRLTRPSPDARPPCSTLKSARDHCSETQGIDLPRDFIKVNSMEAPRP
jgi:hypothetical protein